MHDPRNNFRRGFSFVELLFAIMILGIGFIMIAAIFPVAISQTAASGEETVASTIARGAVGVIQQVASNALMRGTNKVIVPIGPTVPTGEDAGFGASTVNLWNAINGNMILPSDNRYAWAAMYERDGYAAGSSPPYAMVIIVGMQVRNRTQYTVADTNFVNNNNATYPNQPNLQPKQVQMFFNYTPGTGSPLDDGSTPDQVTFINGPSPSTPEQQNASAVAEGGYLIINNDQGMGVATNANIPYAAGGCDGEIYRIGSFVGNYSAGGVTGTTWQLIPGNDVYTVQSTAEPIPQSGKSALMNGLIIGKSIHDPTQAYDPTSNPYEGLPQDINVYVGFVRINS